MSQSFPLATPQSEMLNLYFSPTVGFKVVETQEDPRLALKGLCRFHQPRQFGT
jgi:hypothetical protein